MFPIHKHNLKKRSSFKARVWDLKPRQVTCTIDYTALSIKVLLPMDPFYMQSGNKHTEQMLHLYQSS